MIEVFVLVFFSKYMFYTILALVRNRSGRNEI